MPAGLAGPLSSTPATSAPCAGLILRLSAMSSVTCWMRTPSQPRRVSPYWRSWSGTATAAVGGTGKPMPLQPPAGMAAIDGGVGRDVIVVRARMDVAVARRHDAGRHGAAEAERIADGDHP